jgi:hypothetical protein
MDISTFELRQRIHPDYLTISGWENPDFWCFSGRSQRLGYRLDW